METTRVMLVEDNPEYSEVIRLALQDVSDMEMVGQFGTSEIALRTLRDQSPAAAPDIILLDLRLPGTSGLDALADFRNGAPGAKVIILTQSDQQQDILRAISQGASGYLLKSANLEQITGAIRTVMSGGAPLDTDVAKFILNALQARLPAASGEQLLSDRELEVLSLLADGLVKKKIASQLNISYTTVDTHIGRIYSKLNVNNAASAIDRAHRLRILPPTADDA